MKTVLVAVYDKKGKIYFPIEQKISPAVAIRDFNHVCNQKNSPFYAYPEDYYLCVMGEMDNETGIIQPMKEPKILAEAQNQIIKDEGGIITDEKKNKN